MTQQELERWATARKMKKDFQKVIKAIRETNGERTNPKPMMTEAQMEKGTATVNCGGEWCKHSPEVARKRADLVMKDERFTAFLTKWNATAHTELDNYGVTQIRINY